MGSLEGEFVGVGFVMLMAGVSFRVNQDPLEGEVLSMSLGGGCGGCVNCGVLEGTSTGGDVSVFSSV
jgi:hypothetical protein